MYLNQCVTAGCQRVPGVRDSDLFSSHALLVASTDLYRMISRSFLQRSLLRPEMSLVRPCKLAT